MIEIGDKVKFLNDVGGGTVTSIQSKNVVVVENYDGFEIPYMISQLVKIEDVEPKYSSKKAVSTEEKVERKESKPVEKQKPVRQNVIISGNDEPKFFLAFYPTDQKNPIGGEIEVHLVNDSNFTLLYQYAHRSDSGFETIDSGVLEANTKSYLEGFSQSDLTNLPRFCFRIIPFLSKYSSLPAPIVKELTVQGTKFYKESCYKKTEFFSGRSMVFSILSDPLEDEIGKLTDKDFKAVVNEKDKANRPETEPKPKKRTPEIVEVDLHIEELIDTTAGLSHHEIMEIQMDRFHSEMKSAIEKGVKRIVFIHGVGNGILKQEIQKKMKSTYAKYYFQDASFQEYGYGATMVILRK